MKRRLVPAMLACESPEHAASAARPSAVSADTSKPWILDEHGIGPVRVGMRVAQADTATPGGLDRTTDLQPECDILAPKDRSLPLTVMVEDARVVRVEVDGTANVVTREGARVGDSEARIRRLYPRARVGPNRYDEDWHDFVVIPGAPADTLYRIVIQTDGKKVVSMRGGLWPPVEYVEGCS